MEHFFYSSLPEEYKNELENIFYFNKNQYIFRSKIEELVEIFGVPELKTKNQKIKIELAKIITVQNLFLLTEAPPDGKLIAVLIHFRNNDSAEVIHLAINEDFSILNNTISSPLFILVNKLKQIYHQIKGVNFINFLYNNTKIKIH